MAPPDRETVARYGVAYPAATVVAVAGLGVALGLPASRALFFLTVGAALVGILGASGRGDESAEGSIRPGRKLFLYGAGTFLLAWLGVLVTG